MSNRSARRPWIHFTPERGWINDPHGLTWHRGEYHLFYQCVPDSMEWRLDCHWGHATSSDLVIWRAEEPVLSPGQGDDGVWSGSLVVDDAGAATIFYTSVVASDPRIGRVRVATPRVDDWSRWVKGAVVATAPSDERLATFRDPFVLRELRGWRMLVGAGLPDRRGAVVSYCSPDLVAWSYDGVLAQSSLADGEQVFETGTLWECPQIFELDGSHVLLFSVWADDVLHYVAYAVGSFSDGRFEARSWRQLTFGPGHYAASVFRDELDRPCLLFWLRGVGASGADGWRGALSIPYLLSLHEDVLVATPHPNVAASVASVDTPEVGAPVHPLPGVPALLRWQVADGRELRLHADHGVPIRMWVEDESVVVAEGQESRYRLPLSQGDLCVLIDGPVLETWTDGGLLALAIPALTGVSVGVRL